jgi:hypothetical protein
MAVGAAAAAAAGARQRAFEDLLFSFRQGDATAPTRARSLADLGVTPTSLLASLQAAGVIVPAPLGFYLDERALRAYRANQQKRATLFALVAVLLTLVAGAIGVFLVSRAAPPVR